MRPASFPSLSDQPPTSPRRRAVTLATVIALHILFMYLVFRPGPPLPGKPMPKIFQVFSLTAPPVPHPSPKAGKTRAKQTGGGAPKSPTRTAAPPAAAHAPAKPLNMLMLNPDEFAATDIAKIPSHQGDGGVGAGKGQDSGAEEGAGQGPGGERLYNAEWYREPTRAEMATYLTGRAGQPGWGVVACRTVPGFRVEDCRELGESPQGNGLARAMRLASWQFRVRPPRVGGKLLVGAWVSIKYTITERE